MFLYLVWNSTSQSMLPRVWVPIYMYVRTYAQLCQFPSKRPLFWAIAFRSYLSVYNKPTSQFVLNHYGFLKQCIPLLLRVVAPVNRATCLEDPQLYLWPNVCWDSKPNRCHFYISFQRIPTYWNSISTLFFQVHMWTTCTLHICKIYWSSNLPCFLYFYLLQRVWQ